MLPQNLKYTTWQDSKGDFFKAVAMEKLTMSHYALSGYHRRSV